MHLRFPSPSLSLHLLFSKLHNDTRVHDKGDGRGDAGRAAALGAIKEPILTLLFDRDHHLRLPAQVTSD